MRLFCLTAVLLSAVACTESTSYTTDVDAVRVDVRVVPNLVVLGTDARISVTMTNLSLQPVMVTSCPVYYWVQDANGQIVGGSQAIYCALLAVGLIYAPLVLRPLEVKTIDFTWPASETQSLPLGDYEVYGWVGLPEHRSTPASVRLIAAAQ